MSTALSALRDTTFGRKAVNFVISAYALTALGAALLTSGGPQDGVSYPAVKGYEHILRFMRWVGASEAAAWIQQKVVVPMANHPDTVGSAGILLVILAIVVFCLQRPPMYEIPAQPAYGIVLGAALLIDFAGTNVLVASIGAVLAVFVALFVFGQETGTPWNGERIKEPLAHAIGSLGTALFSAPGLILSLITIAPDSPSTKVAITSLPRGHES